MMSDSMQELKQMRIWFLWRWGTDKNGNPTKVPFAATGGETGTDDAHSSTWVTYDNAVVAAEKYHAAGVGFKIPENYFFLDIDHRELSDPLVQTLLSRFDSYTERSVSGGGIHIYGKCDFTKLPTYIDKKGKVRLDSQFYQKNSKIDLELYVGGITNRFAADFKINFDGRVVNRILNELIRIDSHVHPKHALVISCSHPVIVLVDLVQINFALIIGVIPRRQLLLVGTFGFDHKYAGVVKIAFIWRWSRRLALCILGSALI